MEFAGLRMNRQLPLVVAKRSGTRFSQHRKRNLAERISIVRQLDASRELGCIETRIREQHKLSRWPSRHLTHDSVSKYLHDSLEAGAEITNWRLHTESTPPIGGAVGTLCGERIGVVHRGCESVSDRFVRPGPTTAWID